jgi:putative ABC transport system permease protein
MTSGAGGRGAVVGALGLWLRRLRAERIEPLGIALLVLVTATAFALAPRLATRVADDAFRHAIDAETVAERNLAFTTVDWIESAGTDDPTAGAVARGADLQERLPAALGGLVTDRDTVVDLLRWRVDAGASVPTVTTLRIQPGAADHFSYTAGREPAGSTATVPDPAPSEGDPADSRIPVIEVALSNDAARAAGISLDQTLFVRPDPTDALSIRNGIGNLAIRVVGLYDADAAATYWFDDLDLVRSRTFALSDDIQFVDFAAFVAPASYPTVLQAVQQVRYTWHLFLDTGGVTAASAEALARDLRRLETLYPASALAGHEALQTGLLRQISDELRRWQGAQAILAVVAVGPAVAAIAAVALASTLAQRRRTASQRAWRARGAGGPTLSAALLAESAVVALPAAVLGAIIALVLVAGPTGPSVIAAGLVGLVSIIVLSAPAIRQALSASQPWTGVDQRTGATDTPETSPEQGPGLPGRRRLVLEGLIVGLAAAASLILRERGARSGGLTAGDAAVGIDPMAVVAPTLTGLAAALIAVRFMSLPLRALAALSATRRSLVPMLGSIRAARGASASRPILLVVLLTTAAGTFAGVTLDQVDRRADAVGWQTAGASLRASAYPGTALPSANEMATHPGIEAAAGAYEGQATIRGLGGPLTVLAVDLSIQAVTAGTPADAHLPVSMTTAPTSTGQPVPVIIGTALADQPGPIGPGEVRLLSIGGLQKEVVVVDIRDRFPGLADTDRFLVVARDQLRLEPHSALTTTELFVRLDAARPAGIAAAASAVQADLLQASPGATIESAAEIAARVHNDPFVDAVHVGVAVSIGAAALYAMLAIVLALALSSAARAAENTRLRAVGASTTHIVALGMVEYLPTIFLSLLAGIVVGVGIFTTVEPGLGLAELLGSVVAVPLRLDLLPVVVLLTMTGVVALGAIRLSAILGERLAATTAWRTAVE